MYSSVLNWLVRIGSAPFFWPLVVFYAYTRAIAKKYKQEEDDDDDNNDDDDLGLIGRLPRCPPAAQSDKIKLMAEKRLFDLDVCHVSEFPQHTKY